MGLWMDFDCFLGIIPNPRFISYLYR
jgi:hypothetical protein